MSRTLEAACRNWLEQHSGPGSGLCVGQYPDEELHSVTSDPCIASLAAFVREREQSARREVSAGFAMWMAEWCECDMVEGDTERCVACRIAACIERTEHQRALAQEQGK